MKKTILGLDLGTNSIGWALVEKEFKVEDEKETDLRVGSIKGMGSRIIPMSQDVLGDFDKGNSVSQTSARTGYRGVRRLHERNLLRRERLHRVLNVLGFLPNHFASQLDVEGKFLDGVEVKLPYSHFNESTRKWDFIFKTAYNEMLKDFKQKQPQLFYIKNNGEESKIPYDWTIYYLRKKALTQKIEKEELAWLLLHFNQKRGYYQLRGEDEEKNDNKIEEFYNLKITDVIESDKGKKEGEIWYNVILENGWIYRRSSRIPIIDWKGKNRDFIVTTELNEDGSVKKDKDGKEKRSFRAPKEDDWNLLKKKTESDLDTYSTLSEFNTVGTFVYENLLQNPTIKIKGKFIRTIERDYYKKELQKIISTQINFHPELKDKAKYKACCEVLYKSNEDYRKSIADKDFQYLFVDDILFYQRPLKSKKSEISDCPLESRKYILNDEIKTETIKCIPKSHPLFQEFRLWQWMSNVKIFERHQADDIEVTDQFLNSESDFERLFEFLNERKEIDQTAFLKYILEPKKLKGKALNELVAKYRWNYIDDSQKSYPCNETHSNMRNRLSKVENVPDDFFMQENEIKLWHILYSVTDKNDITKALTTFIKKYNDLHNTQINQDQFVDNFKKYPLIKSEYGSYSEKAIKKLLPLMRLGKYWSEEPISKNMAFYQTNINAVIENINKRENNKSKVKEELMQLDGTLDSFKGLRKEIATYVVYRMHSENAEKDRWETYEEMERYISQFKQHSLRNPIVEQVITETLRVVKDIWVKYGKGAKDFFNEIHIELGREMKNNAADRKAITDKNNQNEMTNLRIRAILSEFQNMGVKEVLPHSPYQLEAFKIYEDGVLKSFDEADLKNEILEGLDLSVYDMSRKSNPTSKEILKYKLWLEQKYKSPYTGAIIPLSKLFTRDYEIEHIIPKSIYFDDSFSNKVICESEVNKAKDNRFGLEFIKNPGIQKIQLNQGGFATLQNEAEYRDFITKHYANNKAKAKKLLLEEVPDKMIERQLNDTRYISKIVKNLLSKIVREEKDDEGVTSKKVISTNGAITNVLKQDWGLNDVWNDLMLPRFERLNELTKTGNFTYYNTKYQKYLPTVPDELRKGFQLKRIDHRHHAMDALIIACTTRNHINYLNNQTALDKKKSKDEKQVSREDLKRTLCFKTKPDADGNYKWQFYKPWDTLTQDAREVLERIVVSFKQNLRVINKTVNYHQKFVDGKKEYVKQTKGENWAVRKPLHKETVYGKVQIKADFEKFVSINSAIENWELIIDPKLKSIVKSQIKSMKNDLKIVRKYFKDNPILIDGEKIEKVKVYEWVQGTASRVALDDSFTASKIKTSITDSGIQKILLNHLKQYENRKDEKGKKIAAESLAFSPEGIEEMNKNIIQLNDGCKHQPILKVRVFEAGNRFAIGNKGNKKDKYVEAAKGTNLYFAIYVDENGKRNYDTIPLNIVIERLKQKLSPVPEKENCKLLFWLSPNDLVYIPDENERENSDTTNFSNLEYFQKKRIYKVVSFTGNRLYGIPYSTAKSIYEKFEFTQLNKLENSLEKHSIKDYCIKLEIDRLGHISIP